MPPTPDRPLDAPACPICGQPNACAAAATGTFDAPCWCQSVTISTDVLARVPDDMKGLACVCRQCATSTAATPAPSRGGGVVHIGVISDTHGLLRPEALAALRGSDRIIHAGDVGAPGILERLREIAPTGAVRGNVDTAPWATALPLHDVVTMGGVELYITHGHLPLGFDPATAGFAAVISGHSHRPSIERRGGVLHLNPGSAGPRRFTLPVTVARLVVDGTTLRAEIVELH